ncbi:hypothetical protein EK0264_07120 [Epidermidibacterium keratini]|uniref:Rv3660c-like CheY-like N-terminal domain-containing protein n=1 Tax=Epidermidibacterium keratini TaxID=1891644 RepID=A0A7L4YLZ3_9ACTN|nr:septum site-determining protein Ssd [Epidermidibacterium keratini]QHC00072.1 hypothetical protein EK0264_07120 [Epidermidibacterium keratini]
MKLQSSRIEPTERAERAERAEQTAASTALVVTADERLRERVHRILAATGRAMLSATAAEADERWSEADVVLVDVASAAAVADLDPPRRERVYLISDGPVPESAWRECVAIGGLDAVDLDEHAHWLVEQISAPARPVAHGRVLGVTGACGGVGASTTTAALALAATQVELKVLVVDADERGGQLDLLLDGAHPGLGWGDLQQLTGRVSGEALRSAITTFGDIPVVTTGREQPPCEIPFDALRTVVAAGAGAFDLTLLDVPAYADIADIAAICDLLAVVTTSDARGGLSLRRWRERHEELDAIVAARTPHRHCLPTDAFTDLAGDSADVVWLSEIRRSAERFGRSRPGVVPRDRIVDDAVSLITVVGL